MGKKQITTTLQAHKVKALGTSSKHQINMWANFGQVENKELTQPLNTHKNDIIIDTHDKKMYLS